METRETFMILREVIGQYLDGDVPSEPGIAGAIHFAHDPGSKRSDDLVGAKAGSGIKRHGRRC